MPPREFFEVDREGTYKLCPDGGGDLIDAKYRWDRGYTGRTRVFEWYQSTILHDSRELVGRDRRGLAYPGESV
jgi:hypothetical protein